MSALDELNENFEQNASAIYEAARSLHPGEATMRLHLVHGKTHDSVGRNLQTGMWQIVDSGEAYPSVTTLEFAPGSDNLPSLLEVLYVNFPNSSRSLDKQRSIWPPEIVGQKPDEGTAIAINKAIGGLLLSGGTPEREQ